MTGGGGASGRGVLYSFRTAIFYQLKKGLDGFYNKELMISRRKESKTLAWSSIMLAFESALSFRDEVVPRPKARGDVRGISYIYLYCIGLE